MITKLNVASIMVLNKEEALDFYVNKLREHKVPTFAESFES